MIDRVTAMLSRKLYEVPVSFKWFAEGRLDGSLGFAGEESTGASFVRLDGIALSVASAQYIQSLELFEGGGEVMLLAWRVENVGPFSGGDTKMATGFRACRQRGRLPRLRGFDLIFHPVALALDNHGVGMMQEPVQHGTG